MFAMLAFIKSYLRTFLLLNIKVTYVTLNFLSELDWNEIRFYFYKVTLGDLSGHTSLYKRKGPSLC